MSAITAPVPDPTLDFVGLFASEDEDAIWGRVVDWANEGLDPVADADAWVDTREGGHWRTAVTGPVREIARLYDVAGTEVPMSAFVLWAWGTYLDDLAAVYDIERLAATAATGTVTFEGPAGSDISVGTEVAAEGGTPDDPAPAFRVQTEGVIPGGGSIDLPVAAVIPGEAGNVAAGAITVPSTPLPAGVTFTNADATLDGTDAETDDALRGRVLEALVGRGAGNQADYVRWARALPGVGDAKVVPLWRGPGTVLVMATDPNARPLSSGTITTLQDELDPVAGQGAGTAPIGAQVTAETSTLLNVDIAGDITYETGYSADGSGGTIAVKADIEDALSAYLLTVHPGDEVVLAHAAGIVATWPGVHDFTGVTINTVAGNLAVGLDPPKAPILNSLTLT